MATIAFTPLLGGQAVLGAAPPLIADLFAGSAAQADAWLGHPAGTTRYDPSPAVAITGVLAGPDEPTVADAVAVLRSYAGAGPAPLVVPTGVSSLGWDAWSGCSFPPSALVWSPGGIVAAPYGYQIGYRLLISRGAPILSGFSSGAPDHRCGAGWEGREG